MAEVLKLLQCSNIGGMENSAFRLMPPLAAKGHAFHIGTPRPFGPGREAILQIDPHGRAFPYVGRFGWRTYQPFNEWVLATERTCSHIWLTGTDASSLRAIRPLRQRKVLGHHYHHREGRGSLLKWRAFYSLLCRQLDAVTYATDYTRNEALAIAPWLKDRSHIVRYVFDVVSEDSREERRATARARLGIPPEVFVVGNAGWLIPRKRWDIFLRVCALVAEGAPDARFVICGGGPLESELRQLARELGIAGQVQFCGWQTDMQPWFDAMDVLLFNSDFDAFGMTPCEAAARGVPVVASVVNGGLGETLRDGKEAYLMRAHDVPALARNILRLRAEPALLADFQAAAAARLRALHCERQALAFYEDFFRSA